MSALAARLLGVSALSAAVAAGGILSAAGVASAATVQPAASGDAALTVIHGVPGVTVDVCADGKAAITGFTFNSQKSLSLPAGTYSLGVVKTGQACTSANYLTSASATLSSGENASAIAYLNSSGKPALGLYENSLASVPSGQGRLVLSHNADAPAVKVSAGGTTLASSLSPGDQAAVTVPAKTYSGVDVSPASGGAAALSGASVPVKADADTIVYVVGSSSAKYSAIVQTVSLSGMPGMVVTGNSPAATHHGLPGGLFAALLALAAAGALASVRLLRSPRAGRGRRWPGPAELTHVRFSWPVSRRARGLTVLVASVLIGAGAIGAWAAWSVPTPVELAPPTGSAARACGSAGYGQASCRTRHPGPGGRCPHCQRPPARDGPGDRRHRGVPAGGAGHPGHRRQRPGRTRGPRPGRRPRHPAAPAGRLVRPRPGPGPERHHHAGRAHRRQRGARRAAAPERRPTGCGRPGDNRVRPGSRLHRDSPPDTAPA